MPRRPATLRRLWRWLDRKLPTFSPAAMRRGAEVALAALTLIVFTGAAVRLTGSGLGCPDWPKCYGGVAPPLETHAWIEFGNRLISGLVGLVAFGAAFMAWRRRPFRRDLVAVERAAPARRARRRRCSAGSRSSTTSRPAS